ncbi:NACHT and Ankyrin domain [Cordyceps militaris]|uniref:NACHT and Ankyrin domain n=1 Tax=Cordyceps militaris TaxID=73501 RepID=A0A2H4SUN4_CORMI|nr:NACHT and Ankyrin domain [Cordyceps militaris]
MDRQLIRRVPPELRAIICQSLAFRDLFNLARSYRDMHAIATEALFRQDAATRNSSAILWAAGASGVSEYADLAMLVLRQSIWYGGQVNARHVICDAVCTAIHVAVAHGSLRFVKELIRLDAETNNTFSLRLWRFLNVRRYRHDLDIGLRLKEFSKRARIQGKCWALLLPAMVRGDWQIVSLLLGRNCSCYLAIHHKYLFMPPLKEAPTIYTAYTIHHFLVEEGTFPAFHQMLFERFSHEIALPGSASAMPPLMKAVEKGNETAAAMLLTLPQDLNVTSSLGWPVLSYAIEVAATLLTPKMRDWGASMVRQLLEKGAGANVGAPSSPLQLAVTSLIDDKIVEDTKHPRRMCNMIEDLLDFGADVNVMMADGHSLSQHLFLQAQKENDHRHLRGLLVNFLDHGTRVNDWFPDGTSMLAKAIAPTSTMGKPLIVRLLYHGARPAPHEYDGILHRWLRKDKTLPKPIEDGLASLAPGFSQPAIDRAFADIVWRKDAKQFDTLKQWHETSRPSSLLAKALGNRFARLSELYALPFNPNWQSAGGQSYAHLVVEALSNEVYNERQALEEMQRLIARGVRVGWRDADGKTVLQRLTAVRETSLDEDPFGKLQKLLMHARLVEQGDEI